MKTKSLLFSFFLLVSLPLLISQNYLRVGDPDSWETPASNEPLWEDQMAHGKFEEVTIIASPQGIYTEIELYATISQGPDAWSWQGEYEIIWQFELPANTIVHDSWLWIDEIIVKADVVDFWTALTTYENIVDRNQDPSFFYQLADKRYEIRIYPLYEDESRRIRMSFLVPAVWDTQSVTSNLLQNILKSTDYPPATISVGMPVSDLWQSPQLRIGNNLMPMTEIVTGGTGDVLHYIEVPGNNFLTAANVALVNEAPLSEGNSFLSTYSSEGENYYQLAFVPDWQSVTQPEPKNALILLDYNSFKTYVSKASLTSYLQTSLGAHFSDSDGINAAVVTSDGVRWLSDSFWEYDPDLFADTLAALLEAQDAIDLELLLTEGFAWAQNQDSISHIYLLAANDDFVYPPVAEEVFSTLQNLLTGDIPFTVLDYQNENISIIYYNNEAFYGNEYFYELLTSAFNEGELVIFRETNEPYTTVLADMFPALAFPTGVLDYTTSLESGIAYHRFSLSSPQLTQQNGGVILQTGKYLGDFPLHVSANLITNGGEFWNITTSIPPDDIISGDTLMKEMWYGPYLKSLEILASSDDDRFFIIEQSINERVLTGLTAFLALEPEQGGEPCIGCLYNNGTILISVDERFKLSDAEMLIFPNPVSDLAIVQLKYTETLNPEDWTATIFDAAGRAICQLDLSDSSANTLEWKWNITQETGAGFYFCKIVSIYGELIGKIIVVPK